MAIVIKEIIVKTTVEPERKPAETAPVPEEVLVRLKEEFWREVDRRRPSESGRKER